MVSVAIKACAGLLSGLAVLLGLAVQAAPVVEVEGSAPIRDGDVGRARLEARQNALREAALQSSVRVQANFATGSSGAVVDNARVRSSARVQSFEVLDESRRGGLMTVRGRAVLGNDPAACDFPGMAYRKKLAAVYFPLADPRQVGINDYYDYQQGLPAELLRRLTATGVFLTRDTSDVSLYRDPLQAPAVMHTTLDGQPLVIELAREYGIQFVVSAVVRDLSLELTEEYFPSFSHTGGRPTGRNLEIEFFIHDAFSGEFLARHRYARHVEAADVLPKRPLRVATRAFFASTYGRLFDRVLQEETVAIQRLLRCLPFAMTVLERRDNRLYLDAGRDTGIEPGDVLTLYETDIRGPIFGAAGRVNHFGPPRASLRVVEVFPGYSVMETEASDEVVFSPGEVLRAW